MTNKDHQFVLRVYVCCFVFVLAFLFGVFVGLSSAGYTEENAECEQPSFEQHLQANEHVQTALFQHQLSSTNKLTF